MYISVILIKMNVLRYIQTNAIYYGFHLITRIDAALTSLWQYLYGDQDKREAKAYFVLRGKEIGQSNLDSLHMELPIVKSSDLHVYIQLPLTLPSAKYDYNMIRFEDSEALEKLIISDHQLKDMVEKFSEYCTTMQSQTKILGMQIRIHRCNQDIKVDFGRNNFLIRGNKIMDNYFIRWYLERYHDHELSADESYTISFINQEMNYVTLDDSDGGIILTSNGYELVPVKHDFLMIESDNN